MRAERREEVLVDAVDGRACNYARCKAPGGMKESTRRRGSRSLGSRTTGLTPVMIAPLFDKPDNCNTSPQMEPQSEQWHGRGQNADATHAATGSSRSHS